MTEDNAIQVLILGAMAFGFVGLLIGAYLFSED